MKTHRNPLYDDRRRSWRRPESALDWLIWTTVVVGGVILIGVVKSVLAAVVVAMLCLGVALWQRRRDAPQR